MILQSIETPADIKDLSHEQLLTVAEEDPLVHHRPVTSTWDISVRTSGGGTDAGRAPCLRLAARRHPVDTGHQAYVHKLLTGRRFGFKSLKQAGGMSGYPNRAESEHDWIETATPPRPVDAHGIAKAFALRVRAPTAGSSRWSRRALTAGGLRGPQQPRARRLPRCRRPQRQRRSYAPTVSQLSQSLTSLRLNPTYTHTRERLRTASAASRFGPLAVTGVHSVTTALRGASDAAHLLRSAGVRYAGPIDVTTSR